MKFSKLIREVDPNERLTYFHTLQQLIPGDVKKDTVVLARRTRLVMAQTLYDKGEFTREEASDYLEGELSPGNPNTYYNDRHLLQIKENDYAQED